MWTVNFQMLKLDLEKAEQPKIKLPTSTGSSKKQESSRKISISDLLTMPKPLTVWITTNCGKFWKRWEYQTTWPASWEICMQDQEATVRTGHETTDCFQIGKGVCRGCMLPLCLFNLYADYIMRNAGLNEAQAGIKFPMESQRVWYDWAAELNLQITHIIKFFVLLKTEFLSERKRSHSFFFMSHPDKWYFRRLFL